MLELLLKASFILGVALLFYKSVLQQESFFGLNRVYMLCGLVLAFALPYLALPKLVSQQGYLSTLVQTLQPSEARQTTAHPLAIQPSANPTEAEKSKRQQPANPANIQQEAATTPAADPAPEANTSWFFWLAAFYLFGVAVFGLHLLFQLGSLFLKIARAPDKIRDGDCVLVTLTSPQAPCSFFNYIFIYPDAYDFETYEQILAHEKIHVRQKHSLDLLLAELAVIVLWFNPLVWIYKKEIEKNLEFQTDALLLNQASISKQQYQLSLLQIATPHKPLTITTNYNQSLLKQRIMMMNAKRSTPHSYWKYAFLAPLLFCTLLLLNEPAISQTAPPTPLPEPTPKPAVAAEVQQKTTEKKRLSVHIQDNSQDMSKGYWYSQQKNGQYCLQLKGGQEKRNWSTSDCFDKSSFVKVKDNLFEMRRESGTLTLTGNLGEEVGQGTYVFTKDPAFEKYLASNNIKSSDQNLLFFLFLNNVDRRYISFLKDTYQQVPGDRLLELAIHGISQKDFQSYISLFQKYSNKKPSIQEVVEADIHGIDQAYVQELQALGFTNASLQKMMEARIHDVTPAYVQELREAGYENLSLNKVIEARIHDMDAASIKEIRALGYDLSLEKMMEVKIHDVNAAFIQDLKAAGFSNLSINQVLQARIHDITPAAIREIKALGFNNLSLDKMVEIKIHDLDAAFIRELEATGFTNLSMDKLLEARIHDVDGDFIKKAREKGFSYNQIDKYITLKIHDLADVDE